MELRVRLAVARGQVAHDVLGGPAAPCHNHRACPHPVETSASLVCDRDKWRPRWITFVLDAQNGGVETDARRIPTAIERTEVHAVAPHRFHPVLSRDRI